MKIEKINENKLKIILSKQDLMDKNIDFHLFSKNNIEVQELFLDILHEAEVECNFNFSESQLLVEGMYNSGDNFIITVTKLGNNHILPKKDPELKIKRKSCDISSTDCVIYGFSNFENFIELSHRFKRLPHKYINTLYELDNNYYLSFSNLYENKKLFKKVSSIICEYGSFIQYSHIFKSKLNEYSSIIMEKNAIQTANKYFI